MIIFWDTLLLINHGLINDRLTLYDMIWPYNWPPNYDEIYLVNWNRTYKNGIFQLFDGDMMGPPMYWAADVIINCC